MSLKPQPLRPIPPEMADWGAKYLANDDPYKLIGDTLYEQYHDEQFADLYHPEGKPALSPVLLAFVTIFQNLENLSDRKTVEAPACNLKWKYALHLPLDADAFDPRCCASSANGWSSTSLGVSTNRCHKRDISWRSEGYFSI
jgi:transposase